MITILRKELADYFTSIRCIIIFALAIFISAAGLFAAYQGIRGANLPEGFVFLGLFTTSGEVMPSVSSLLTLLIPIIGIALGFDAINSERSGGTLSRLLAQPVYRDNVINGKFLAGLFTLTIMLATILLLVFGYGMRMIGITPSAEEGFRLFMFFLFAIIYGAFWMGLAMLFSVVFRRIATSLLVSIGVWVFFWIFIQLLAPAIANSVAPTDDGTTAAFVHNYEVQRTIMRFSPITLFSEATSALLLPRLGENMLILSVTPASAYMLANPLSLGQSLVLTWPQFTTIVALSAVCFGVSYVVFMRQEIRST